MTGESQRIIQETSTDQRSVGLVSAVAPCLLHYYLLVERGSIDLLRACVVLVATPKFQFHHDREK